MNKEQIQEKIKERSRLLVQRVELEDQYKEWMFTALPEDVRVRLQELEQERNQLLDQVAEIQADLEAEMNTALENADKTISGLEDEIKAAVIELKESVKVEGLANCIFNKGKITWDNKPLVELAKKYDFIAALKKEGEPYAYFK